MGNQMMYPRNAVINSSDTSTSAKRSIGNIIERRKELHERRMARIEREKEEARLKERGLWDWITDDVLGISWNCYVVGYPKWNDGCAATSGIRSPVQTHISCPNFLERNKFFGNELGEQTENPGVGCFPKMVEKYGYYRDASRLHFQLSQSRGCLQWGWITGHAQRSRSL
jgi:hypothetical protein